MRWHWTAAFFVLTFAIMAGRAAADDCGPLKEMTSLDLATNKEHSAIFAPVTLNGQPKFMLVDTGGAFSMVSQEAAEELNLSHQDVGVMQYDISGRSSHVAAMVGDFGIGALHGTNMGFMISADPNMFGNDKQLAGVIGPNILHGYDVDIDFGHDKLNLMSPDHCPGKVIYWQAGTVAVVPVTIGQFWHVIVPVTLDGHRYRALIDTGASDTALNLENAESDFGLKAGTPGMTAIGQLADRNASQVFQHKFGSLSFEGISVTNPTLYIIPDLMKNGTSKPPPSGTRLAGYDVEQGLPDLLVGMDVLKHFHIYIAYKEQRLYITPTDAPQPMATVEDKSTPAAAAAGSVPPPQK